RLIAAHLGKYLCTDPRLIDRFIDLAGRHENVVLDVSGVVLPQKIRDAVRRVGSKRVTWGTDGPRKTPEPADFARIELAKVRAVPLEPTETADVLGGTIAALLGLE
ncbi:MAG: amidohydrolase family protein, partial [Planctomycetota bacterium]